jgi:hypothetical protein
MDDDDDDDGCDNKNDDNNLLNKCSCLCFQKKCKNKLIRRILFSGILHLAVW